MVKSELYDLNLLFQALADPTRRSLINMLSGKTMTVSELAEPFEMSLAAVSKHLKVLERAKLIQRKKQGSHYYMSFNAEAMMLADQWLGQYRGFWDDHLESLRVFLEQSEYINNESND